MNKEAYAAQIGIDDQHIYELIDVLVDCSGCKRGSIHLFNVLTEADEVFTVWEDSMDPTELFVLLPTGDNNRLVRFNVTIFGINPVIFTEIRNYV